jgi:hypothetical protein
MKNVKNNQPTLPQVWVFNGGKHRFPSAVFSSQELAEGWIAKTKVTGTLTAYPVDMGVHEWAIEHGHIQPTEPVDPEVVSNFSHAAQEHFHYHKGLGERDIDYRAEGDPDIVSSKSKRS